MPNSSRLLGDTLAYVPTGRQRRRPPYLDNWDQRNRRREKDIDDFDDMKRRWYQEERDPRWAPPIPVPAPWDKDHGIGGGGGRVR